MFEHSAYSVYKKLILLVVLLSASAAFSTQPLDKSRYISLDEVKAGMNAWCLTVYEGTKIEKFGLEVISVVRNFEPGRNAILVKGTDPRFIYSGPVAGCSGSPVYIDGRLAGALAFSLSAFAKDPLYGVTPIEEMLKTGDDQHGQDADAAKASNLSAWNFAHPADLLAAADTFTRPQPAAQSMPNGAGTLPTVLTASQLPTGTVEQLNAACSPLGLAAVTAIGGGSADANLAKNTKLEPGSVAVVPLIDGDLKVTALGTVTDVVGDKVYVFGHGFLGHGQTDLPLATGNVDTIVASLMRSFKFGHALEVRGSLTSDEATAVVGRIGRQATTIPLTIKIDRYNDSGQKVYNCRIVNHQILSPIMVMTAVSAATLMRGPLPPEHCMSYKTIIGLDGFDQIVFENMSTGDDATSMIKEGMATVGILLNNPYIKVKIRSLDFEAKIMPKNIISHIWSLTLSDMTVKPGQTIDISAVVEPYLAAKKTYDLSLQIPYNLKAGDYELTVTGAAGYEQFLRRVAPERFRTDNLPNTLNAMRNLAQVRRDRLYVVLMLATGGVTIENAVLNDLPSSKTVVLQDDKRMLSLRPYQNWIEKSMATDSIVGDSKTVRIKVEKQ